MTEIPDYGIFPWDGELDEIHFSVPIVKGKERPRHNKRTGHTYTPNTTVQAENMVRRAYLLAAKDKFPEPAPIYSPVAVEIHIYKALQKSAPKSVLARADYTCPDVDNPGKLVMDALTGAAYVDDRQVVDLQISRHWRVRRNGDKMSIIVFRPKNWHESMNEIREKNEETR